VDKVQDAASCGPRFDPGSRWFFIHGQIYDTLKWHGMRAITKGRKEDNKTKEEENRNRWKKE